MTDNVFVLKDNDLISTKAEQQEELKLCNEALNASSLQFYCQH
jgi:hypothetical protein